VEGIFVAGAAAGPKDIPDSIVEAGAAAMEAAIYLRRNGRSLVAGEEQEGAIEQPIAASQAGS
jgi:heterodisulfide reductase subunit A-like polyferredoxin